MSVFNNPSLNSPILNSPIFNNKGLQAHRAAILHFVSGQTSTDIMTQAPAYEFVDDGLLVVDDGRVAFMGPYDQAQEWLVQSGRSVEIQTHDNAFIMPGFIDTHIHYPQSEIICSHGQQLLEWLQKYTFPAEQKFSNIEYATQIADTFCDLLLENGITSCMTFATTHPESVNAIFLAAQSRKMRMIAGKVMMDRNAPAAICQPAAACAQATERLIEQWHGQDRLSYALTPRFAPTSTSKQLQLIGAFLRSDQSLYMQTHLAENLSEIAWVRQLFPDAKHYLDVYDQYGLLSRRSIFAHAIHLANEERQRLAEVGATIAFCPSSNLFLGSGLLDMTQYTNHPSIRIGLGTDVGAGSSFSMFQTFKAAYESQQLLGHAMSPFSLFYLATLGGARALDLDSLIGNFDVGKEADFIVLKMDQPATLAFRSQYCTSLEEKIFALAMLGDDRTISGTYVMGQRVSA